MGFSIDYFDKSDPPIVVISARINISKAELPIIAQERGRSLYRRSWPNTMSVMAVYLAISGFR